MSRLDADVVILGSGFGGSLTGAILSKAGRRVLLLDRARHPRFAIGESSTPTANLILKSLAEQHGLKWLVPLAKFGSWRRTYPTLTCGIKRGFSYFHQQPGRDFELRSDHRNELLVAASSTIETADTQWMRSEVDAFLFDRACEEGCDAFQDAEVTSIVRNDNGWLIEFVYGGQSRLVSCRFVIDGTGTGSLLARWLPIEDDTQRLKTSSRAVFAHLDDLPRWPDWLMRASGQATPSASSGAAATLPDHPWPCDDAALHQLVEEGWFWWLRFETGRVSVGLMLDTRAGRASARAEGNPRDEWNRVVNRYPSLREIFRAARVAGPGSDFVASSRLQRLMKQAAGTNWALLPHTAGFIDPLHSTGIAHTVSGIERLTNMLIEDWQSPRLTARLAEYDTVVRSEITFIDDIVSGCYAALAERSFRKFVCFSMAYFAAATSWERRRLQSPQQCLPLFCSDDSDFRKAVATMHLELPRCDEAAFESRTKELLAPFNHVGLFAPPVPNMYLATAVPEEADKTGMAG